MRSPFFWHVCRLADTVFTGSAPMSSRETWFERNCLTLEISHVGRTLALGASGAVYSHLSMLEGRGPREKEQLKKRRVKTRTHKYLLRTLHGPLPTKCFALIPAAKVPRSSWHIGIILVAIGMKTRVCGGAFCPLLGVKPNPGPAPCRALLGVLWLRVSQKEHGLWEGTHRVQILDTNKLCDFGQMASHSLYSSSLRGGK